MILTERQSDALAELVNIAFARTAAALSDLTGRGVRLNPPEVSVHPALELPSVLARFLPGEVTSIHQVFVGPVSGDALLLLNYDGALQLASLLTQDSGPRSYLDESSREVLTEVGNILLNACLGMFGNLLQVRFSFSVPGLHMETLDELLDSLIRDTGPLHYALVIATAFQVRDSAVSGYLVIVLTVASLDRLVQEVEGWELRQGA
jgi:chemotaxis protein CheC